MIVRVMAVWRFFRNLHSVFRIERFAISMTQILAVFSTNGKKAWNWLVASLSGLRKVMMRVQRIFWLNWFVFLPILR